MSVEQETIEEMRALSDATRWAAIETRDRRFDGLFFYGVRSTGVYCKPTCPSRRPRPEQVAYFPTYQNAEAAGFRACKRCNPRDAGKPDKNIALVTKACRIMDRASDGMPSVAELSGLLGTTPANLQRMFKRITGVTPRQYAVAQRVEKFKSLIDDGSDVTGAMYDAGYGSSRSLYEKASSHLGMTPATYRRRGKGMKINYAIADCYLGRLLIAATERGVCAVSFGDDDESLIESLTSTFEAAIIRRDDAQLSEYVKSLLDYLSGAEPDLDLPLDVQATAFQSRVWEELRKIPYGSTRSYGDVAKAIGKPGASRAVASACASNSVALVIPCHRVVREDGSTSGYRWGPERKVALLAKERG